MLLRTKVKRRRTGIGHAVAFGIYKRLIKINKLNEPWNFGYESQTRDAAAQKCESFCAPL